MDLALLEQRSATAWEIPPRGAMRVPAVIYASEALVRDMDHKVYEQAVNVAALPGIVTASYAMPDAHWGYGFPIGGVAAFDPDQGGVVSAGGVGFDISCGVRCLHTGLRRSDLMPVQTELAEALYHRIPAGVGSTGSIHLNGAEMDAMLAGGAKWAVDRGWGRPEDLERIEEYGQMRDARPDQVSTRAKRRQRDILASPARQRRNIDKVNDGKRGLLGLENRGKIIQSSIRHLHGRNVRLLSPAGDRRFAMCQNLEQSGLS